MNEKLTELQKQILEELKAEIKKNGDVSIPKFTASHFVSPAFLVKLSQKLGYSGYKELIFSLKMQNPNVLQVDESTPLPNLIMGNYSEELVKKFTEKFTNAKQGYIYATGKGYSSLVVEYMSIRCVKKGYRFLYMETFHELPEHECNISILISSSGETDEIIEIAKTCQRCGNYTIAFVQNSNSRLAKIVNLPIIISKWKDEERLGINSFLANSILAFDLLIANV